MRKFIFALILNGLFVVSLAAQIDTASITWFLDRTDSIGGYTTTALRKVPAIIETAYGKAALFSCSDSTALLVNCNPIGIDTAFTVEVFFRPDSTIPAGTNNEQRFIHIRNLSNDNRRILLEIRQLQSKRWLLDTYIKSESSNLTLVDSSHSHSSGEWHHVALTYSNGTMRQFVDGVQLLSGPVTYLAIDVNGKTAIGARQDPRSWFNGAIRMIKISKRALTPAEFSFPASTKVQDVGEHPIKNHLLQNYPNPFNPNTSVTFTVKKESPVTLKVYDVLGRELSTLVHETKSAGTYTVLWDASAFQSGIYFCKMQTGSISSTLKMFLMK